MCGRTQAIAPPLRRSDPIRQLNKAGNRVNERWCVGKQGTAWRYREREVCFGVRTQCSELNHGVVTRARSPVHSSEAAVVFTRPRAAMMREYRVEKMNDPGTPCIEFGGAQGFHGANLQAYVWVHAEQRRERCDMSNAFRGGVDARLEADVDLATVVSKLYARQYNFLRT